MKLAVAVSLVLVALVHPRTAAQAPDSRLEFFGFRAGARLEELDARLQAHGGRRLRCDRSKVDSRVSECRGVLNDPAVGGPIDIWVSAVDSSAGIITLSGAVGTDQFERWRQRLQRRYGRVGAQVQGSQWMMQWVRQGRMLRLTWRVDKGDKVASVSLVDGHILDGWGKSAKS